MASRIQGITVEIGGDTTKLSSALSGVNKEIKNTQTQLKDVEKLLKLDPSNTELVTQKQKLLKDAIAQTKEKLETLKLAAEQANEQLQKGEITQQQYDALQRENGKGGQFHCRCRQEDVGGVCSDCRCGCGLQRIRNNLCAEGHQPGIEHC